MNYIKYIVVLAAVLCLRTDRSFAQDDRPTSMLSSNTSSTQEPLQTKDPPSATTVPPKKVRKDSPKRVCPKGCSCEERPKRLTCSGASAFPDLTDWAGSVHLSMRGSSMANVELGQLQAPLRDSLEILDLAGCEIKSFGFNKKDKDPSFNKLKTLLLNDNMLQSIGNLSKWKFPVLETIDLGSNPLVELGPGDFNNTKGLLSINLQNLRLKSIHEQSFLPLSQLKFLNMTGTKLETHLGDKQFVANQKLETLDLTDNGLIEVPFSLRSTNSITRLILNSNQMTSLRQSDFINRTKLIELEIRSCPRLSKIDDLTFGDLTSLKRLILADNPALNSISNNAFKSMSGANHTLDLIDMRDNNLSSLVNPMEFGSLTFEQLLLSGNPWHCDCSLRWFEQFSAQSRPLAHCKSPAQYRDIEVGEFLSTIDCETAVDSILRTVIVTGFFLFLIILTVLVFVQKSDLCRRFFWRDQYGTIYYTKASFPPETT